jgi:hypothetical protein
MSIFRESSSFFYQFNVLLDDAEKSGLKALSCSQKLGTLASVYHPYWETITTHSPIIRIYYSPSNPAG